MGDRVFRIGLAMRYFGYLEKMHHFKGFLPSMGLKSLPEDVGELLKKEFKGHSREQLWFFVRNSVIELVARVQGEMPEPDKISKDTIKALNTLFLGQDVHSSDHDVPEDLRPLVEYSIFAGEFL